MNCKRYRTEIDRADLGAGLSAGAQAHLRGCADCRVFYDERLSLRRLLADVEKVNAPPDFEFRLRARMSASGTGLRDTRPFLRRFAPGFVALSAAAIFVFTLAALRQYQNKQANTETAQTPNAVQDTAQTSEAAASPTDAFGSAPAREALNKTGRHASSVALAVGGEVEEARAGAASRRARQAHMQEAALRTTRAAETRSASRAEFTAGVGGAKVLRREGMEGLPVEVSKASVPFAVPINASAQPLKVLLKDEQGEARVVSIKPVSFGAQELVGRASRTTRASLSPGEGVW